MEYQAHVLTKEWVVDGNQKYTIIKNLEGTLDFKYILDKPTNNNFANLYVMYFYKLNDISKILMPSFFEFTQKLYD